MDGEWRPKIRVQQRHARAAITWLKERSEALTVLFAAASVVFTLVTALAIPEVWPLALVVDVVTFLSALLVVTRVQVIEASVATAEATVNEATLVRSCPDCGEALDDDPNVCSECGWESDNPVEPDDNH